MAITVQQVFDRAGVLLSDTTNVRWTTEELLNWLNDGRREMAVRKPSIFGNGTEITHTTTDGNKQTVTTTGAYRIDSVNSNVASGKAIRVCDKAQLDAFKPAWRNDTAADAQNWWGDETDPLSFWIYPSVGAGRDIKAHVHITPADLSSMTDTALPFDIYEPALVNYLCFRMLSKDAEYAGNAQAAAAYYQLFTTALA